MSKLIDEIKVDASFINSHTLQPGWYKVLKVFILLGFLVGYAALFGWRKMGVFLAVFLISSAILHMLYRINTKRWTQSWLDFVVEGEGPERKYQRIGKFYYTAIIVSAITAIAISQVMNY